MAKKRGRKKKRGPKTGPKPARKEILISVEDKPVVTVVNGQKKVDWEEAKNQFATGEPTMSIRDWAQRWGLHETNVGKKIREGNWYDIRAANVAERSALARKGRLAIYREAVGRYGEAAMVGAEKVHEMLKRTDDPESVEMIFHTAERGIKIAMIAGEAEARLVPTEYSIESMDREKVIEQGELLQKLIEDDKRESRTDRKREDD